MYIELKKLTLEPDKYGGAIAIKRIAVMSDDGKFERWANMTPALLDVLNKTLLTIKIPVDN